MEEVKMAELFDHGNIYPFAPKCYTVDKGDLVIPISDYMNA